jgi:hypothetical protein
MRTSLRYGENVVYLLHRSNPSFLKTSFAQRMLLSVTVTDTFPCPTVFLVYVSRTHILVVLALYQLFMFITILTVRQPWASRIGAAPLWFSWHIATSFWHKESLHRILQ